MLHEGGENKMYCDNKSKTPSRCWWWWWWRRTGGWRTSQRSRQGQKDVDGVGCQLEDGGHSVEGFAALPTTNDGLLYRGVIRPRTGYASLSTTTYGDVSLLQRVEVQVMDVLRSFPIRVQGNIFLLFEIPP